MEGGVRYALWEAVLSRDDRVPERSWKVRVVVPPTVGRDGRARVEDARVARVTQHGATEPAVRLAIKRDALVVVDG